MTRFERLLILCTLAVIGTMGLCTWLLVQKLAWIDVDVTRELEIANGSR